MKYKVICIDMKTVKTVEADSLYDAVKKIKDERLSPSTYKALKELGVGPNQWKNWSQEQANRYIEQKKQKAGKKNEEKKEASSSEKKKQPIQSETFNKLKPYFRRDRFGIYNIPKDWSEEDAQEFLAKKERQAKKAAEAEQKRKAMISEARTAVKEMFSEEQISKADDAFWKISKQGYYYYTDVQDVLDALGIDARTGEEERDTVVVEADTLDETKNAAMFFRSKGNKATIKSVTSDGKTYYYFMLKY